MDRSSATMTEPRPASIPRAASTPGGFDWASREFLYVEDCAEGILLAAERYEGAEPVNLGTGSEITIRDLVTSIARLTGFTGEIRWSSEYPDGQPRRCLDTSRAEKEFGFRATTGLEEGLRRTTAWYEQHAATGAARS